MKEIDDLTKLIICLVPIGCIARIVALLIKMSYSDETTSLKARIKNTLIFLIFSSVVFSVVAIIKGYYL